MSALISSGSIVIVASQLPVALGENLNADALNLLDADGAPIVTHDIDIVHRQTPENVDRLVEVLDAHRCLIDQILLKAQIVKDRFG